VKRKENIAMFSREKYISGDSESVNITPPRFRDELNLPYFVGDKV
jgi:hypothetical protein